METGSIRPPDPSLPAARTRDKRINDPIAFSRALEKALKHHRESGGEITGPALAKLDGLNQQMSQLQKGSRSSSISQAARTGQVVDIDA